MKALTALLFSMILVTTGCYSPEVPSEADQYFNIEFTDGLVLMGKGAMVHLYLGDIEGATQYFKTTDRESLKKLSEDLKVDIDAFKTRFERKRLVLTSPDKIDMSRSNGYVLASMKVKDGDCLYYLFGFKCDSEHYMSRAVDFSWAKEHCTLSWFKTSDEVPFPFIKNARSACFW